MMGARSTNNTLYLASSELRLPSGATGLPGAGHFHALEPDNVLTAPGSKAKSLWRLPAWMGPSQQRSLSYHGAPERWQPTDHGVLLQTVAKGQEFVMDIGEDPQALDWVLERCAHPLRGAIPVMDAAPSPARRSRLRR